MYSESEARKLVVKAGHELIEKKLIARTWGNISARISDTQFVITPSGRAYETLKEGDLVVVNIADCSYEGDIKPSSEKGIHAACYLLRKDADFVIHTHQLYASAICAEEKSTDFAPCARYGLSGTKKLKENVAKCIKANPEMSSFLMAKHGALCIGRDCDDAFALAEALEENCRKLFLENSSESGNCSLPWLDDYAQMFSSRGLPNHGEDKEAVALVREKNELASRYVKTAKPISKPIAHLEHLVYTVKYSKQKDK